MSGRTRKPSYGMAAAPADQGPLLSEADMGGMLEEHRAQIRPLVAEGNTKAVATKLLTLLEQNPHMLFPHAGRGIPEPRLAVMGIRAENAPLAAKLVQMQRLVAGVKSLSQLGSYTPDQVLQWYEIMRREVSPSSHPPDGSAFAESKMKTILTFVPMDTLNQLRRHPAFPMRTLAESIYQPRHDEETARRVAAQRDERRAPRKRKSQANMERMQQRFADGDAPAPGVFTVAELNDIKTNKSQLRDFYLDVGNTRMAEITSILKSYIRLQRPYEAAMVALNQSLSAYRTKDPPSEWRRRVVKFEDYGWDVRALMDALSFIGDTATLVRMRNALRVIAAAISNYLDSTRVDPKDWKMFAVMFTVFNVPVAPKEQNRDSDANYNRDILQNKEPDEGSKLKNHVTKQLVLYRHKIEEVAKAAQDAAEKRETDRVTKAAEAQARREAQKLADQRARDAVPAPRAQPANEFEKIFSYANEEYPPEGSDSGDGKFVGQFSPPRDASATDYRDVELDEARRAGDDDDSDPQSEIGDVFGGGDDAVAELDSKWLVSDDDDDDDDDTGTAMSNGCPVRQRK